MDAAFHAAILDAVVGDIPVEPPPAPPPLATEFRAAAPHNVVRPQLGALADLPGTWVGKGFNLVALPLQSTPQKPLFRLMLNATTDTITFKLIGAPIPDRGSAQPDIFYVGVHYFQQVADAVTNAGLHLETGMWLNLPATAAPPQPPTVARLSTIPHGDSLLAQGPSAIIHRGPLIKPISSLPFTLDAQGRPVQVFPNVHTFGYLDDYSHSSLPPGISQAAVTDPTVLLRDVIAGQTITKTAILVANARPVGGINNQPIVPPNVMNDVGGIVNIPFVTQNANANAFSGTFWIETVRNPDGTEFLQLQYSQTTILDFFGIKWPHITVGTLIQQ